MYYKRFLKFFGQSCVVPENFLLTLHRAPAQPVKPRFPYRHNLRQTGQSVKPGIVHLPRSVPRVNTDRDSSVRSASKESIHLTDGRIYDRSRRSIKVMCMKISVQNRKTSNNEKLCDVGQSRYSISLSGYRVVARASPGMAAGDAPHSEPQTLDRSVLPERLDGIFRACGRETACRRLQGRDGMAVEMHRQRQYPCYGIHSIMIVL